MPKKLQGLFMRLVRRLQREDFAQSVCRAGNFGPQGRDGHLRFLGIGEYRSKAYSLSAKVLTLVDPGIGPERDRDTDDDERKLGGGAFPVGAGYQSFQKWLMSEVVAS